MVLSKVHRKSISKLFRRESKPSPAPWLWAPETISASPTSCREDGADWSGGEECPFPALPSPSPGRSLAVLHLPWGQHSKVELRPGLTVREQVDKVLQKRKIKPSLCSIREGPNPESAMVDLNLDCGSLRPGTSLWVHSTFLPMVMSIKHSFVRKTFISLTYCSVCDKSLWLNGYQCQMCLVRFHQKCWGKVPTHCEHVRPINRDLLNRLQNACLAHSGADGQAIRTFNALYGNIQPDGSHAPFNGTGDHLVAAPDRANLGTFELPEAASWLQEGPLPQRSGAIKRTAHGNDAEQPSSTEQAGIGRDRSNSTPNINCLDKDNPEMIHRIDAILNSQEAPGWVYHSSHMLLASPNSPQR